VYKAAHEEFVGEVVDDLADLNYLKVRVMIWFRSAPGEVPNNAELSV
jgi:hypothetical protein